MSEPLFWYRPVCNGEMYEGPIHNNSVGGKMLRDEKPGEWFPLYTEAQAQSELNAARALLREALEAGFSVMPIDFSRNPSSLESRVLAYLDACDKPGAQDAS